jgi:two-component system, LytTR family, response regulator
LKPVADLINEERAKEYGRILAQYQGVFLENFEGEWCEPYRTEYHLRFVSAAKRLIQYSVERDTEYLSILNLVELLTKYEPYDEAVRGWAMQLQYRLTGKQGVQAYFKKYQKLLEQELGEKPEEKLCGLYDQLTGNA